MDIEGALGILIGIIALIAVFTFMGIAVWTDNRRKEREAYYHNETLKKLVEQPGDVADRVLDKFRRDEIRRDRQRRDGLRLGGMVTIASGVGLWVLLNAIEPEDPYYLVGLLPVLIGAVLLAYSFMIRIDQSE